MSKYRYWLLVALTIILVHAPSLAKPFLDSDEAVYATVAALTNSVGRLYAEGGVDNKFPGIFWIYAGVFRVFGQYSMTAVHAFTICVVLGTSAVLAAIAARVGYKSAGSVVALFYGIVTTFFYPKMQAANTEIFTMLPLSAAVLLSLPTQSSPNPGFLRMFLAGMLIGIATTIRQLAGFNLMFVCGLPLFWSASSWLKRVIASSVAALGFVCVAGSLVYFFYAQGTLHDFLYWTVAIVFRRYLPAGWHAYVPTHQLGMLAETVVFWILVALRVRKWQRLTFAEKALWGWLLVSLAIVILPGRFNPHYAIQAFAPLVLLSGLEFKQRLEQASERKHRRFVGWSIGLLTTLTLVFGTIALWWEPFAPSFFSRAEPQYLAVARYVRESTAPTDRVFVWGAYTPIYVMSDRLPATRFVAFKRGCGRSVEHPFDDCWDSGPEMWPLLERDLEANAPALIIDTAPANLGDFAPYPIRQFPLLRELLERHYTLDRTVNGVEIYRRRTVDTGLALASCCS